MAEIFFELLLVMNLYVMTELS